jgi:hypothetical protein
MKIYVFKALMDDMNNTRYDMAKNLIKKKFTELKNKIILNFKEGFWKKDVIIINVNIRNQLEYFTLLLIILAYGLNK